jgi:hypothetical protein
MVRQASRPRGEKEASESNLTMTTKRSWVGYTGSWHGGAKNSPRAKAPRAKSAGEVSGKQSGGAREGWGK